MRTTVGFGALQLAQQSAHLFAIADALLRFELVRFGMRDHIAKRHRRVAIDELPHHDAACDHREISGERALSAKMAQHGHVVIDDGQKHLAGQIFAICGRKIDRTALGRVVDHVDHEAHEAIYEVLPRTRFAMEAAIEQTAINFRQRHRHHLLE